MITTNKIYTQEGKTYIEGCATCERIEMLTEAKESKMSDQYIKLAVEEIVSQQILLLDYLDADPPCFIDSDGCKCFPYKLQVTKMLDKSPMLYDVVIYDITRRFGPNSPNLKAALHYFKLNYECFNPLTNYSRAYLFKRRSLDEATKNRTYKFAIKPKGKFKIYDEDKQTAELMEFVIKVLVRWGFIHIDEDYIKDHRIVEDDFAEITISFAEFFNEYPSAYLGLFYDVFWSKDDEKSRADALRLYCELLGPYNVYDIELTI